MTRADESRPQRRLVDDRQALMGVIHRGAAHLGLDDTARRRMQARLTGHESCRDMDLTQLRTVAWHLKRAGADIGVPGPRREVVRLDRVSSAQLHQLERLAVSMGWSGLGDERLQAFVRRTAKIDHLRFLTRSQATACITGLGRWLRQIETSKP